MPSYVTYGKKRKTNKTSKVILAVLALASLVLVLYMFMKYTTALNMKNDIDNEISDLNTQYSYLTSQKNLKETELSDLEKQMEAPEAEYASYQD